jgi:peroxiredoxin/predicted 2-oxoglutarate/Fe(II)-dependent dioxygenase YbiX
MAYAVGDWVSDFRLPGGDGKIVALSDVMGVPHVLVMLPIQDATTAPLLRAFAEFSAEFAKVRVPVLAIVSGAGRGEDSLDGPASPMPDGLPFPILSDTDGKVFAQYDAIHTRTVVIDLNGRVGKIYEPADPAAHVAQVLADVKAMVEIEEPRRIIQQAPVLLIPNVMPPEACRELIQIWETQGNEDSGFMKQVDGKTVGQYDYNHKIRRDHMVLAGTDLFRRLRDVISRRVVGEVWKCFNYQVTRLEDMKIACYDAARGGYFRPHRDNTTEATAHRRFACSLLLNDDYEGGYLRFAEYAPHLYRPPAGGAIVFSGSMLHEATDVTAGRRFVLLTFFYGEREAKAREEYNKRVGGGYRAGA